MKRKPVQTKAVALCHDRLARALYDDNVAAYRAALITADWDGLDHDTIAAGYQRGVEIARLFIPGFTPGFDINGVRT